MAALDFPASPTLGDTYTANGKTWKWDGTAWQGVLVDVVYETETQTITNKTISADNNTLSGISASSFVLSNSSGNIDGSAAQKVIPSGVVVGTTDTQTLTNKTINATNNTVTNISLTTAVTGTLPVGNGGTGATTLTANTVLLGNGTSAVQEVAPGTSGNVLTSNGTTWTSAAISSFPSGTKMLFQQTAAPTGWTKDTTHNNKAFRVVSGTAGSGGTVAFTTAFASQAVGGTVGGTTATNIGITASGTVGSTTAEGTVGSTTLTTAQIPSHTHPVTGGNISGSTNTSIAGDAPGRTSATPTSATGGGGSHNHTFTGTSHTHTFTGTSHNHTQNSHTHTFTGTAIDLAVQYVDIIIATKN